MEVVFDTILIVRMKLFYLVLVSLKNSEVRVYKDKYLVNSINTDVSAVIMLILIDEHHPIGCSCRYEVWTIWTRGWCTRHGDSKWLSDH